MKPSAPQLPPADPAMSQFAGMQPQVADIGMQVMEVEPLLNQLANQVPALAPAADQLLGEMKSRMGAPAIGIANLIGGMMGGGAPGGAGAPGMGGGGQPSGMTPGMQPPGMPAPGPAAPGIGGPPPPLAAAPPPPGPPGLGAPPVEPPPSPMGGMAPQGPGGPIALPQVPPEQGLMDIAMQLEVKLPGIGSQDPTLLPEIQYFVAKMREEIPKALNGDQDTQASALQEGNPAPTDTSLKSIPSLA